MYVNLLVRWTQLPCLLLHVFPCLLVVDLSVDGVGPCTHYGARNPAGLRLLSSWVHPRWVRTHDLIFDQKKIFWSCLIHSTKKTRLSREQIKGSQFQRGVFGIFQGFSGRENYYAETSLCTKPVTDRPTPNSNHHKQ